MSSPADTLGKARTLTVRTTGFPGQNVGVMPLGVSMYCTSISEFVVFMSVSLMVVAAPVAEALLMPFTAALAQVKVVPVRSAVIE